MIKDPLKKLRTTFNYLVVNLCVCDLIDGVIGLPLFLVPIRFNAIMSSSLSVIFYFLSNIIFFAVSYSMCALSIDRYRAIMHPIKYRHDMSWTRCIKYTLGLWLLAIVSSLLFLMNNEIVSSVWINVNIILISAILVIVYVCVKKALRTRHAKFEERTEGSLPASPETVKNRLKTEQRVTLVYVIILITVLVTTLPVLVIFDIMWLYQDVYCLVGFIAFNVRVLLLYSNSVMNPLVCMFMLKNFKESIKVMFCCCVQTVL